MIERLITIVFETFLGKLDEKSKVIFPVLESASINKLGTTYMTKPMLGLFVHLQEQFPNPLKITFRGYVNIGSSIQNPPHKSSLQVVISFSHIGNPINGEIAEIVPVKDDGTFEAPTTIIFISDKVPRPRLVGKVNIKNTSLPVESQPFQIENALMDWLIDFIDREENRIKPTDHLDFVSSVRKLYFSESFNKLVGFVLGRNASTLYENKSDEAQHIRVAETIWFENEWIRIGHVLTGIEGGRKQNPQPKLPSAIEKLLGEFLSQSFTPLIGDLLTWTGDLSSALNKYLYQHFYTRYYLGSNPNKKPQPDFSDFDGYLELQSGRDQLIADIDGINLADFYDRNQSLADNLNMYYLKGMSKKRFSFYLQTQKTDDGQPALIMDPQSSVPMISTTSRQFLAERISKVALFLLIATVVEAAIQMKEDPLKIPFPDEVQAKLKPSSVEVQKLVNAYVTFIQKGLLNEHSK